MPATARPSPYGTPSGEPSRAVDRRARLRRMLRVVGITLRHAAAQLLDLARPWRWGPARRAARLRELLESLGVTAIKIGQILSTRPDVIGPAYITELSRLQDSAPPEAPGVVDAVIARELGAPPTSRFAAFDAVPIAAASIGQAHSAVLHDGTAVVVKVRRPGVVAQVEVDLDILERGARTLARWLRAARRYDVVGMAAQFASTLRAELDYRIEAANVEHFARDFADRSDLHIPRVFRAETTSRVITLEQLRGTKPDDLIGLERAGVDRPALAQRCADIMLTMIFEHGFFHADPHAGNFFVESDGTIGLIDFGMVGRLDGETRAALVRVLNAVGTADTSALADSAMELGVTTGPVDRVALLRDLDALVQRHLARPLGELKFGELLVDVMGAMRRHRLRLPANLALLAKTFAMSEGLAAQLDPEFRMAPVVLPYVQRLAARRDEEGDG